MRYLLGLTLVLALAFGAVACDDDSGDDADSQDGVLTVEGDVGEPDPNVTPAATKPDNGGAGPPPVEGEATVTDSGLQIIDTTEGDGDEAEEGATVTVHYTGYLDDGSVFDSTEGSDPITFELTGLIAGWQEGIPGMREGGTRRLIIPPELAYGEAGRPGIPGNATLTFDITLVSIG